MHRGLLRSRTEYQPGVAPSPVVKWAERNRRTSFLKKRSKKLLLIASSTRSKWANPVLPVTDKSFLVLFFKKELLPSSLRQAQKKKDAHLATGVPVQ
jgi:hypothetical protein